MKPTIHVRPLRELAPGDAADGAPLAALAWLRMDATPDPAALTSEEQALFATHTAEKRRVEWWSGRQAAHAALEAIGARGLSVLADPRGVPELRGEGAAGCFVSITHGRRIAAAVASRPAARLPYVGVDMVDAEDGDRIVKIAARVLTPAEKEMIELDRLAALLAWGTREAIAKATSTGMFMFALAGAPMTGFEPRLAGPSGVSSRIEGDEAGPPRQGRITTDLAEIEVTFAATEDGGALVVAGATRAAVARAQAQARVVSK